jgi:hypothetical protein
MTEIDLIDFLRATVEGRRSIEAANARYDGLEPPVYDEDGKGSGLIAWFKRMLRLAKQPPEIDPTIGCAVLTNIANELRNAVDEGLITADDCNLALKALERTKQARDLGWWREMEIPMPPMYAPGFVHE